MIVVEESGLRYFEPELERSAESVAADACASCGGLEKWTSTAAVVVCRRCHPPAPDAEAR